MIYFYGRITPRAIEQAVYLLAEAGELDDVYVAVEVGSIDDPVQWMVEGAGLSLAA